MGMIVGIRNAIVIRKKKKKNDSYLYVFAEIILATHRTGLAMICRYPLS